MTTAGLTAGLSLTFCAGVQKTRTADCIEGSITALVLIFTPQSLSIRYHMIAGATSSQYLEKHYTLTFSLVQAFTVKLTFL